MLGPFLLFGFSLGVKHALEADHVAAVASLASRSGRPSDNLRLAALWGAGHAGVLVVVGGILITLGLALPDGLARFFEGCVGLVLIALGFDVLGRLRQRRVHVHAHRHGDGTLHLHAHSHLEGTEHLDRHPPHEHHHIPASRALVIGGAHGLAGSAALVLLALQSAPTAAGALACLVAFGGGSILGMMLFSLAISLPLRLSSRNFAPLARRVEATLGTVTVALGGWIVVAAILGG